MTNTHIPIKLFGLLLIVLLSYPLTRVEAQETNYIMPIVGSARVTDAYGEGTHVNGTPSAEAIDFAVPAGTPVYPVRPGTVISAEWDDSGFGNLIKIKHENGDVSYYAHLSKFSVVKDQYVYLTTKIGEVGSTGYSTGAHLHFEVRTSSNLAVNVRYMVNWNPGCPCVEGESGTAIGPSRVQVVPSNGSLSSSKWFLRVYNIDDIGTAYINGVKIVEVGYSNDSGWIDITSKLTSPINYIRFTLFNNPNGYTWGFAIKRDDTIVWQDVQGKPGDKGANNDDQSRMNRMVYDRTITINQSGEVK